MDGNSTIAVHNDTPLSSYKSEKAKKNLRRKKNDTHTHTHNPSTERQPNETGKRKYNLSMSERGGKVEAKHSKRKRCEFSSYVHLACKENKMVLFPISPPIEGGGGGGGGKGVHSLFIFEILCTS